MRFSALSRCRIGFVVAGLAFGSVSAARAAYDLVVTDIGGTQSTAVGSWVTFSATIENRGDAATPEGVVHGVSFWVDGQAVSWSDTWTGPLQPGQSVVVQANSGPNPAWAGVWAASAGTHQVAAWVDDINRLPDEADENNNEFVTSMSVASDSVEDVQAIALSGQRAGDSIYFTAIVDANNGDPTAHSHSATVTFYLDGNQLCASTATYVGTEAVVQTDSRYRYIQLDGTGAMENANGIWTASAGVHTIEARIEGGGVSSSQTQTFLIEE